MFERFTERARKVMMFARQEALRLHFEFIGPEHILLGILKEGSGTAVRTFTLLNLDSKRVRQELELFIKPKKAIDTPMGQLPFSPQAKHVIELAGSAASKLEHNVIGTEHLLLGLIRNADVIAAQALCNLGLKDEEVETAILATLASQAVRHQPTAAEVHAPSEDRTLLRWASSYRALADRPRLQETIVALIQQGKSIALIGAPHVGKTSLVMALCRAKSGGFEYEAVDYRWFDPLQSLGRPASGRPNRVLLAAEAELFAASRSEALKPLARAHLDKERLILEFRDGAFEAFAARYPNFAKSLTIVVVAAPDTAECREILESSRRRLKDEAGLQITDAVLTEADRLARAAWPKLIRPWQTLAALWKAEAIHRETEDRGDLMQLEKDVEALEKSDEAAKREEAKHLRLHLEGLRGFRKTELSIESVRRAIGELSGQSASESI